MYSWVGVRRALTPGLRSRGPVHDRHRRARRRCPRVRPARGPRAEIARWRGDRDVRRSRRLDRAALPPGRGRTSERRAPGRGVVGVGYTPFSPRFRTVGARPRARGVGRCARGRGHRGARDVDGDRQLHGHARLGEVPGGRDDAGGARAALVGRPRPGRAGTVPPRGPGGLGDRDRPGRRGRALPGDERPLGSAGRHHGLRRAGGVVALPDRVRRVPHVRGDVGPTVPRRDRAGRATISARSRWRNARTRSTTSARCAAGRSPRTSTRPRPIVVSPFRADDCTIEVDGACALVRHHRSNGRGTSRRPPVRGRVVGVPRRTALRARHRRPPAVGRLHAQLHRPAPRRAVRPRRR